MFQRNFIVIKPSWSKNVKLKVFKEVGFFGHFGFKGRNLCLNFVLFVYEYKTDVIFSLLALECKSIFIIIIHNVHFNPITWTSFIIFKYCHFYPSSFGIYKYKTTLTNRLLLSFFSNWSSTYRFSQYKLPKQKTLTSSDILELFYWLNFDNRHQVLTCFVI